MDQKQIQLEIFEQTRKAKKETNKDRYVSENIVNLQFPTKICIQAACLIIAIIISFALGVEKGKKISKMDFSTRYLAESKPKKITKEISVKKQEVIETPVENKKLEKKEKNDTLLTSGYIIQVASYKKNSSYIQKEVEKLKSNGYKTMTVAGGDYMGICAGMFSDKQEAQKHLKELQRTYKDCFIKKI
ncbi:MAG: SPOR domain-containing protein [Candidatus Omnitrophota bacterium]